MNTSVIYKMMLHLRGFLFVSVLCAAAGFRQTTCDHSAEPVIVRACASYSPNLCYSANTHSPNKQHSCILHLQVPAYYHTNACYAAV
jgi:hypothetical protein